MPYSDGAVSPIRSGPSVPKKKKKRRKHINGQNQWESELNVRLIMAKIVKYVVQAKIVKYVVQAKIVK